MSISPIKGVVLRLLPAEHSVAGLILVTLHINVVLGLPHLFLLSVSELCDVPMVLFLLLGYWPVFLSVTLVDAWQLSTHA